MNEKELEANWKNDPRWKGITRPYSAKDVVKLQGSLQIEYTLAKVGAKKLWDLLSKDGFVRALGAMSGNQAVQQVQAGLKSIYVSGWQVAADQNDAAETYPDLSLYPVLSVPHFVRRVQKALTRADQVDHLQGNKKIDWFVPIVADAEAGFGGSLNAFELVKAMIQEGVAAVHLEDQLSSLKKCGHMGGKVLVPIHEFVQKLITARLASDVLGVPTLIIARTDAESATFIHSDGHDVDKKFVVGERTEEGLYRIKAGIPFAIERALQFAPYADVLWCETQKPDLKEAKEFAEAIHAKYPGKWLAYNCSPSFNWAKKLSEKESTEFQAELAKLGYKYQFVTLAGFHSLNAGMFELSAAYAKDGMGAYSKFQQSEEKLETELGYKALKHQAFVGAGYYDAVTEIVTGGDCEITSLKGSTEEAQF